MKRLSIVVIALVVLVSALPLAAGAVSGGSSGVACTAYVARIETLDAGGTRYAVALQSETGASTISGTLALFATGDRYDVPFADVRVAGVSDRSAIPVPIVVQFPAAVHLDGAVVAAVGSGSSAQRCVPPFLPWVGRDNDAVRIGTTQVATIRAPYPKTPYDAAAIKARWDAFRAQAAGVTAIGSGAATAVGPPACAQPYRVATTRYVSEPELAQATLMRMSSGIVQVRVLLDAGSAITGATLLRSSGDRDLDRAAIDAVQRSEFAAPTFRCEPASGVFVFTVSFGP